MSLSGIKKGLIGLSIALTIVMLGGLDTNAQSRRDIERERQRIERENARNWERERQRPRRQNQQQTLTRQEYNNAYFSGGYEQGYLAGTSDRSRGKYNRSNVYRDSPPYPTGGDPTSADYLYRQGYLAGYADGFYGRSNY